MDGRNRKVNDEMVSKIVDLWTNELLDLRTIANQVGCSPSRVKQILNLLGIDTSKRLYKIICLVCGNERWRGKKRVRNTLRPTCSKECYYALLAGDKTNVLNRHGMRIGRAIVSKYYDLQEGNVVHHIDGNDLNNDISNLMVFKDQGEHLKYHRKIVGIFPIWQK